MRQNGYSEKEVQDTYAFVAADSMQQVKMRTNFLFSHGCLEYWTSFYDAVFISGSYGYKWLNRLILLRVLYGIEINLKKKSKYQYLLVCLWVITLHWLQLRIQLSVKESCGPFPVKVCSIGIVSGTGQWNVKWTNYRVKSFYKFLFSLPASPCCFCLVRSLLTWITIYACQLTLVWVQFI